MTITYTLNQKDYLYFMDNRNEPAKLEKLPYYLLSKLKLADIRKLQSKVILPFSTIQISVENNHITFIRIIK